MGNYSLVGGDVMMSQSLVDNGGHQWCNSEKINLESGHYFSNWNNVTSD